MSDNIYEITEFSVSSSKLEYLLEDRFSSDLEKFMATQGSGSPLEIVLLIYVCDK